MGVKFLLLCICCKGRWVLTVKVSSCWALLPFKCWPEQHHSAMSSWNTGQHNKLLLGKLRGTFRAHCSLCIPSCGACSYFRVIKDVFPAGKEAWAACSRLRVYMQAVTMLCIHTVKSICFSCKENQGTFSLIMLAGSSWCFWSFPI